MNWCFKKIQGSLGRRIIVKRDDIDMEVEFTCHLYFPIFSLPVSSGHIAQMGFYSIGHHTVSSLS